MLAKVVIPTVEDRGLESRIAEHFGRAPYFAVVELDENGVVEFKAVSNVGEHFGGAGYTHDNIMQLKPDAVIVYGMGPKGLSVLQSRGIAVFKAEGRTVKEAVLAYFRGELRELTEGCAKAHHSY